MDNIQLAEPAQRAINGDMSAFEEIYIELSPAVMSIAAEITHNDEDASDLMQDCFVAALEKIGTLKNPEKLKSWLMRIAANKCYDYIKKNKPVILSEEKYELIDNVEEKAIDFIPDSSYEHNERIEEVRKILDSLSEDKRLCLLMHYKYDMNYAEIADELGITVGAVKSKIFRAKNDIEKEAEKRKKKGMPLFGVAPFGLAVTALIKSADTSAAAFAGSTAQSAAFSGISVAAASSAAAAGTAASVAGAGAAGASTVSGAVTAGTSIGAKIAALSVAQKVIAGVSAAAVVAGWAAGIATVAENSDKNDVVSTTAYTEEYTTAPSFETTFAAEAMGTVEFSETTEFLTDESKSPESSASKNVSTDRQSTTVKASVKSTSESSKRTTATKTTKVTTTKRSTTTKAVTTKKETTTKQKATTTTKKETTTKANTTKKETTATTVTTTVKPTTAKPTTTLAQTTDSRAVVTVTVWSSEASSTKVLYFNAGEKITATEIENRLSDEYGIEAIADDINITAEAGGNYAATAYE